MISITKTGWGFLGLSFLLYLSSMQSESGLLFLILGIIAGCFVINILKAYKSVISLKMADMKAIKVTEGKKATASFDLGNTSNSDIGLLKISSPYGELMEASRIGTASTLSMSPEITFPTRGVYMFDTLKVASEFPFGLARFSRKVNSRGEFLVLPALYNCQPPKASGFEPMLGGAYAGIHRSSSGIDFTGVRPIQPTDPVKAIHWKSSSKGLGLMVREYSEELSGRISFILDCSPSAADNGERHLDWAVRCLGSLLFAALDAGHHTEMIDLAESKLLSISPFSDGDPVLERLARIKESKSNLSHPDFDKVMGLLSRKSAICIVLTEFHPQLDEILASLMEKKRVCSVYLPAKYSGRQISISGSNIRYYTGSSILE